MIILLLLLFLTPSIQASSEIDLIISINEIVDKSLSSLSKLGKLGSEKIEGPDGGYMEYRTVINGLNSVLNTIDYFDYKDGAIVINGTIWNETDWGGSGNSLTGFVISGPGDYTLRIEMSIDKKIRSEGIYVLRYFDGTALTVHQRDLHSP